MENLLIERGERNILQSGEDHRGSLREHVRHSVNHDTLCTPSSHNADDLSQSTIRIPSLYPFSSHPYNASYGHIGVDELSPSSSPPTPRRASTDLHADGQESKHKNFKFSEDTWALEICAILVNIAAVIATLILLVNTNGLPLSEYRFIISFNAVISILGAITRASLGFTIGSCLAQGKWNFFQKPNSFHIFKRFEEASRGPWGSLQLLVSLKIR